MPAYTELAEEIIEAANAFWEMFFTDQPYTSVNMIDYLRTLANVSNWSDVLKSGFDGTEGLVALSQVEDKIAAIINDPSLSDVSTGESTFFADRMIQLLKYYPAEHFKFELYDLGRFRVARCQNTGLLIDASSVRGAFLLPEGEWVKIAGSRASWKWLGENQEFVSNEPEINSVRKSKRFSSKEEALTASLLELTKARSIPTIFRSFDQAGRKASFHAMIKWTWQSKSLEIFPDMAAGRRLIFKFEGGTDATNMECIQTLVVAIREWGGPHAEKQWALVKHATALIWDAAVEVWGKPQCSLIEQ